MINCLKIPLMKPFKEFMDAGLDRANWGAYDLVKKFESLPKSQRLSSQYVYAVCRGEKEPQDKEVLYKLAAIEELGLNITDLLAWYGLKDVGKEAIFAALDLIPETELEQALQKRLGLGKLRKKN
jgi:hypothetical protein